MGSLRGRRVLVTRAREDAGEWAAHLERAGARAVTLPCIECHPVAEPAVAERLEAALAEADWLVVTSRRGVEAVARLLAGNRSAGSGNGIALRVPVAAVGPRTAAAARMHLGRVDLVSRGGRAASLGRELAARISGRRRFLLALAENAGPVLETILARAGGRCTRIQVYRTVPAAASAHRRPISELRVDTVLLASPSAVSGFLNQVELDRPVEVFTIGPSTSRKARAAGLPLAGEAPRPSLDGLLEVMG